MYVQQSTYCFHLQENVYCTLHVEVFFVIKGDLLRCRPSQDGGKKLIIDFAVVIVSVVLAQHQAEAASTCFDEKLNF